MIQGLLFYKEIEFEFVLEDDVLNLKPKKEYRSNFIECFRNKIENGAYTYKENYLEDDFLIGQRLDNYQYIIFIPKSMHIYASFISDELEIMIKEKIHMSSLESVNEIHFYCKELNAIYDNRQAIEKRGFNNNGEAELKLKSFKQNQSDNISFTYKGINIECSFGISKLLYRKITEYPVQIRSQISLKFNATDNYMLIVELYDVVKRFIQFLCYRKNITIEETIILNNTKEGNRKIGTLETNHNTNVEEDNRIIESRYISYENINKIIGNIFQSISNYDLFIKHLPESYEDGKVENESSFIMSTAAFEWEFRRMYPEGIVHSKRTKEAQNNVMQEINGHIINSKGKKKKIYKNLLKFVELEGLAEKLEYTCKDLDDIIFPFGNRLYKMNNEKMDYKKMGKRLSEQRNHFAHGDIDQEFIGLSLLDLIFLKEIIYAMQLKRLGAEKMDIQKSLNKLFNAGVQLDK